MKLLSYSNRKRRIVFWLLLGAGVIARIAGLGLWPPGLNQDEASAGYEAWSLLHYGTDRNGWSWPVLFVAWGSGQNVLYSYLSIPLIALFGLNETVLRVPAALFGCLSLPLFAALGKKLRGEEFSLWALAALALNPWHTGISRWALESNLLPFWLLLGTTMLVFAEDRPPLLAGAAAAFALALYAYGTAYFFLLFFLPPAFFLLLKRRRVPGNWVALSAGVFILMALPLTACHLRNALGMDGTRFLCFSLPKLNESRQSSVSALGGGFSSVGANLKTFFRLLWTQSDGLVWNSGGPAGLIYGKPGLLLAIFGLTVTVAERRGVQEKNGEGYLLCALPAVLLSACLIDGNVNRLNMAFLPLIWYQAAGAAGLCRKWRGAVWPLGAALLAGFLLFGRWYITDGARSTGDAFFCGLGDAIAYAAALEEESVFISFDVNMPYIYVLFYEQIPPEEYLDTRVLMNPGGAFEWVSEFGGFRFGRTPPPDGTLCIVKSRDAVGAAMTEAVFGSWAVCRFG